MKDFFISYNKADRTWAEWMAWQLEETNYTTLLQAWDFRPGSNFVLAMQQAASEAERTIAVLSPDYLGAQFTQPEWAAAFAQDPTGEKGTLLPVRVRQCDLKGLLPQIIYIELVGLGEAAATEALLTGVQRGRAKPATAPSFPGAAPRSMPQRPRFPGTLPPIWNVPHLQNHNFTGREGLLGELRTALTPGQPAALTQAISGLGGVGKTQLATEYAYRHMADYSLVWWVGAEEPAKLASDYAQLAGQLELPEKEATDQRVVVDAVRSWLGQNRGWLLIFDNAPGPEEVRPYLPRGGGGHVLVTSRNPNWGSLASSLSVKTLEPGDSVKFLLKRTGRQDQEADEATAALAEALGHLPLALEQAGAYIEQAGTSLSKYLELFGDHQRELLGRGNPPAGYEATVATTWEISFQQVSNISPGAADLLNLCAFLAPDEIPKKLLREGSRHLPQSLAATLKDTLAFNDAVAALRRYSLIEVGQEALSVHRLVQAVARNRLAEDARRTWAAAAVRLVNDAFPFDSDDFRSWPECSRLLSHALAATEHAEPPQVAPEATVRLLNHTGLYLRGRAEFAQARAHFKRALKIAEAAYGPNHPDVASSVNNLGSVLRVLGDLAGARAHYQRALQITEAAYGSNHPKVAIRVNNLGRVLRELGDLTGARAHFERTLEIDEAAYGPNHPTVAIRVNNLGSVLQDLGDLAGAREHFERALEIDEAAYGPNHPKVATRLNNLGNVLQNLGDLVGARAHLERALEIDEAAYGPDHPEVATDVSNLGAVLYALGDLAGARAHYQRALKIYRDVFGDDHPDTVRVLKNLELLDA